MSNFDRITETPEVLAAFLAALPVANGPWDQEFHARYCADCLYLGCDSCPHSAQRNNPLWWLMQNAAQERESKKKGESGMDEQRIYRAALEKWGADAQTLMAFEEMAELQKELCKCARGNDNWEAIAEEIADVEIMLEQMKILHDCAGVSAGYKRRKLERLVERLGGTGLTMAFRDGVKPAKLGPRMVFQNGRIHAQDAPEAAADTDTFRATEEAAQNAWEVQWHAGRALALLKKVCAAEKGAASILGAALYTEITTAAAGAWNARTVNAAEKAAISKLLSTDAGKRAQDAQAEADVGAYVEHGLKVGVEDPAALVYFADLENQGGGGASARVAAAAKKPVTLDTLHAAGLADRVMGKYSTRRKSTYNAAQKLTWSGATQATKGETKMNRQPVSYLQTDPRWKNKPYRVKGENSTIGDSGCGPTAAAMLIETITGKTFTPEDACAWALAHGYKALKAGTYYAYFKPQFAAHGINCDQMNWINTYGKPGSDNHKKAFDLLKQGYYLIALMGKGLWTGSGHFVVVWWEDGKVHINDPASTKPARLTGDLNTFKAQVKYYWWIDARQYNNGGAAVTAPVKPTTPAPTPAATAERKATGTAKGFDKSLAGTYTVTAGSGLHIRNVAGSKTGSMIVLPCGTKVKNYGYFTQAGGVKWLYIQVTYQGVKYTGFSSGEYLKKQ